MEQPGEGGGPLAKIEKLDIGWSGYGADGVDLLKAKGKAPLKPPNALHLTKVDSIGPVAGAVLVGVDIWPFAKFE